MSNFLKTPTTRTLSLFAPSPSPSATREMFVIEDTKCGSPGRITEKISNRVNVLSTRTEHPHSKSEDTLLDRSPDSQHHLPLFFPKVCGSRGISFTTSLGKSKHIVK